MSWFIKCPCEHKWHKKLFRDQPTRSLPTDTDMTKNKNCQCLERWWDGLFFFFKYLFLRDWEGDRELTFGGTHSQFPDVQIDFSDLFMSMSGEDMLYSLMKYPLDKKVKTVQCQCEQLFLTWCFRKQQVTHWQVMQGYSLSNTFRIYLCCYQKWWGVRKWPEQTSGHRNVKFIVRRNKTMRILIQW